MLPYREECDNSGYCRTDPKYHWHIERRDYFALFRNSLATVSNCPEEYVNVPRRAVFPNNICEVSGLWSDNLWRCRPTAIIAEVNGPVKRTAIVCACSQKYVAIADTFI